MGLWTAVRSRLGGVSTGTLLLAWAGVSVLFLLLLVFEPFGHRATIVLDDYAGALVPALAGVACLSVRRRRGEQSRRAWLLLGLSLLSWAAGGVSWTVYEVHQGVEVPFPSIGDAGYLLSVPLALAALMSFPDARVSVRHRIRLLLDGVIASGSLLFVSWIFVLGPTFRAGAESLLGQSILLAYPIGDVLTATVALLTLGRARGERRVTMSLIGSGLLIVAVADSSFSWFTAQGSYATGNLFDTGYVAGFLLIAVAAVRPSPGAGPANDALPAVSHRLAMTLPYLPLAISLPFALEMELRGRPFGLFAFLVASVVIIAVLVRQLLTLLANSALGERLHDTVAALRHREVELHYQAFHDPLTGLANRSLFAERISDALQRMPRRGSVILLLADLDDFKTVNDAIGHPAGDTLLVTVSERLLAIVGSTGTVARLGGDEFAVLLEAAGGLADARRVAERIALALLQPVDLSGVRTVSGASIGIVVAGPAATGETLLRDADIAMYAAKAEGKGGYVVYADELAVASVGRLELKSDLSEALVRGELSVKYQPLVDLTTGQLVGVEALLRWVHPVRGGIPRKTFIPLAEASGAMLSIGRWVLIQACGEAARWQQSRPEDAPVTLSVNLSRRQLADPQLIPTVRTALVAAGLPAGLLTLEISERVLDDEDALALSQLLALRTLGVRLAINDFGTGHSALSRLGRYPIDTLKVDRSFVAALSPLSATPDVLITAVLALGASLGMNVVAKGIETQDQLNALRAMGCPQGQGFLFARPAQPEVISELIRSGITLADPATTRLERLERLEG